MSNHEKYRNKRHYFTISHFQKQIVNFKYNQLLLKRLERFKYFNHRMLIIQLFSTL